MMKQIKLSSQGLFSAKLILSKVEGLQRTLLWKDAFDRSRKCEWINTVM